MAVRTADRLAKVPGVELVTSAFFNEFAIRTPKPAAGLVEQLADNGILAGVPASRLFPSSPDLENVLLVAATELVSDEDIELLAGGLEGLLS